MPVIPVIQSSAPEVVAALLCSFGTLNVSRPAGVKAWKVTAGNLPADGGTGYDSWIACRDVTAKHEGAYQRTGQTVLKPRVQVLTRHKDYGAADYQSRLLSDSLSRINRLTITTDLAEEVLVEACCVHQPSAFLYSEEKNRRQVFVVIVQLTLSPVG